MLIGITPGRSLRWAPRWEPGEHSVLFDACSGDYWVLPEATRQWLEELQARGPLPSAAMPAPAGSEQDAGEWIAELARSGLVAAWADGQRLSLAALGDTAA